MKKIISFLTLVGTFAQLLSLPIATAASIQSTLSNSSLIPGQIVTLQGLGFGALPVNASICFGPSICSTTSTFQEIVTQWSDTSITLQIPYAPLPSSGILRISSGKNQIEAGFTYDQQKPEIRSASPKQITAEETIITITGTHLRSFSPNASVCINGKCIINEYLSSYVLSWTNDTIQIKVPYVANTPIFSLTIGVPIYQMSSGGVVQETLSIPGFSYKIEQDPTIISTSPSTIVPGKTVVKVVGSGFENAYKPGWHSVCFNGMCLTDETAIQYIRSWSNTEITFVVPKEFSLTSSLRVSLFLKFPSENVYRELPAPFEIVLEPLPVVEQYTQETQSGGGALFIGKNFGNNRGKVWVGGTALKIISWSDNKIEVYIPPEARSGDVIIRTEDDKESLRFPLTIASSASYSSDRYSGEQWYYPVTNIDKAWQYANMSTPITIAVLDSGVSFDHEDMQGKSWKNTNEVPNNGIDDDGNGFIDDVYGWNFVDNTPNLTPTHEHGTMVASTIVASKDNLIGFAGVAPNARIMSLVVTKTSNGTSGPTIPFDAAQQAIKYAVDNGAKIINLSFSGATPSPIYTEILNYAYKHNVLVVAAAGNNAANLDTKRHSPICDESSKNEVLGVSSVNSSLTTSGFANYGNCIDIFAPGDDIFVAIPSYKNNDYAYASGTSFAAPMVSGIAALLWSTHPDWNAEEIRTAIISSTKRINGLPLLDAKSALLSQKPVVDYTPALGTQIELKDDTSAIEIEAPKTAPIEYTPPSAPTDSDQRFPDVPIGYVHFDAIKYLAEKDIIQGYPSGEFAPERSINRAEFLKIVLEAQGFNASEQNANCFSDVQTAWYAPYVCFAKEQNYVEGYPEQGRSRDQWVFRPEQTINKVEATKILLAVFGEPIDTHSSSYQDVSPVSWYMPYVAKAESLGLFMEQGLLYPAQNMTRGKISEMTYRLLYIREKGLPRF